MDELYVLVVLATILWSAIGGLFGKKKPQQPSPGRQSDPLPGMEGAPRYPEWDEVGRPEPISADERARGSGDDASAAEMIPDELWQILTGERRAPVLVPYPSQYDEIGGDDESEDYDDVAAYGDGGGHVRTEGESLASPMRSEPSVAVSLQIPSPPERRREFVHEKRTATASVVARSPGTARPATRMQALRRAMVLREVLGPPKALE